MHAVIFANGRLAEPVRRLPPHDMLIGADGGARLALSGGLLPDEVIGDLDSLSPSEVAGFDRAGAGIHRYPEDKDQSDLELALDFAKAAGAEEITCYGLFGGRWDMSFSNLFLLAAPPYADMRIRVVEGQTRLYILHGGQSLDLKGRRGERVSVLPLNGAALGVTYQGLNWPLKDAELPFGSSRGVSNTLEAEAATIGLSQGVLLVVHERQEKD
jgi:thiamine pyrophosphokinase